MGEFLTVIEPTKSEYLGEEELTRIVELVYTGRTLLEVCTEMKIGRHQIDIAVRKSNEFREALNMALAALGDMSAETAKQVLENPELTSRKFSLDERKHLLRLSNLKVEFAKWFADRTSNYYKPKSPEKQENKRPKQLVTSVPPREDVKNEA